MFTYINKIVIVSNQEIPQNTSFMEVSKANHVLHALDGGRVHGFDPPLGGEPLLLPVIVHHLDQPWTRCQ